MNTNTDLETFSRAQRIIILWTLLVLSYALHGLYHLSELFFGIDIRLPDADGTVPVVSHIFRIVLEVGTIVMILVWLKTRHRSLAWFSLVWSVILFILNGVHLVGTLRSELDNYSQVALLLVILIVNGFLSWELWQKVREKKTVNHAA